MYLSTSEFDTRTQADGSRTRCTSVLVNAVFAAPGKHCESPRLLTNYAIFGRPFRRKNGRLLPLRRDSCCVFVYLPLSAFGRCSVDSDPVYVATALTLSVLGRRIDVADTTLPARIHRGRPQAVPVQKRTAVPRRYSAQRSYYCVQIMRS